MKIKPKLIETVRIREDRAKLLKDKCFELSLKAGEIINEADLINFMIDNTLNYIELEQNELKIKPPKK